MDIVIASNNRHKVAEIKDIIGSFFDNVYTLGDLDIDVDVVEDGTTFEENAIIKARTIAVLAGMAALADDSGLEVTALGMSPGVYSARYAGGHGDDNANNQLLLDNLKGLADRSANFTSAVALVFPDGNVITAIGKTFGHILTRAVGDKGFGYDPLFYSDDLACGFGVATSEEKNAVSHRGRALAVLKEKLLARNAIDLP